MKLCKMCNIAPRVYKTSCYCKNCNAIYQVEFRRKVKDPNYKPRKDLRNKSPEKKAEHKKKQETKYRKDHPQYYRDKALQYYYKNRDRINARNRIKYAERQAMQAVQQVSSNTQEQQTQVEALPILPN